MPHSEVDTDWYKPVLHAPPPDFVDEPKGVATLQPFHPRLIELIERMSKKPQSAGPVRAPTASRFGGRWSSYE